MFAPESVFGFFNTIPRRVNLLRHLGKRLGGITGNTACGRQITVDEQLRLAYLPVESPRAILRRPSAGNQSFRRDAGLRGPQNRRTQVAFPACPPSVVGHGYFFRADSCGHYRRWKTRQAVAQPSKQGFLYVFDRITGKPVWPIPEKPVEVGSVPAKRIHILSPFLRTLPRTPQWSFVDDLIDFTPGASRSRQKRSHRNIISEPVSRRPRLANSKARSARLPSARLPAARNWPGGSYDPETHIAYIYACNACVSRLACRRAQRCFRYRVHRRHCRAGSHDSSRARRKCRRGFSKAKKKPASQYVR